MSDNQGDTSRLFQGYKVYCRPYFSYKGKTVPCIVKTSEGGSISEHILTNGIMHLYELELYYNDRKNGIITKLLVDGHVSSFDLFF